MVRFKNRLILLTIYYLLFTIFLNGCATVSPSGPIGENDKNYVPVVNLCQQYGFDWQWDPIVRIVTLKKKNNEVKLLVGSSVIIVNGLTKRMTSSAKFSRGAVVVPVEFKELIKDLLIE